MQIGRWGMVKGVFVLVFALVLLAGAAMADSGLPQFRVPDCLGVNIHFTGAEDKQVEQIAAAGFRFIRMDYIWRDVETEKGKYSFRPYDELVDSLAKRGIRPLFILCYGNPLYDGGAAPHADEGRKAFASYARAAAQHFRGKGVLWELWNEPNLSKFWQPESNVGDYVKLAKAVYPAIKQADQNATVLAPALAGWSYVFAEDAFKLGLLDCCDVVSLHAYGAPEPEDAADYFARIRELVTRYAPKGRDVPIVSGEWGYPAVAGTTVEMQGEYIAREFLTNLMSDVRLSIWYDWHDDGSDPNEAEHHFGTVYPDFKEKPAYLAAKTLMSELNGFEFANRIEAESDEDYFVLFRKGEDVRMAAWTSGEPHKIKIPMDVEQVELVSLKGERSKADVKDGNLELALSGAVQYVEPVGKSRRWAIETSWKLVTSTYGVLDGMAAIIDSESTDANGVISVSGPGVQPITMEITGEEGGTTRMGMSTPFVCPAEGKAKMTVTFAVKGLKSPLVRVIEIDTSGCPLIEVLPPAARELWFSINKPVDEEEDKPFEGAVYVGNTEGLRLDTESCKFTIPKGQTRTTARVRMTQDPAAVYSFAYRVLDEKKNEIVRGRTRRYAVVEKFADGKAGSEVRKYQVELDGDSKVNASAKLTYQASPPGAPEGICAKLDYEFGDGWRFVRISPRPMIKIVEKPASVKMWIKGDGSGALARLRFVGSDGQVFQPDFGRLDFTGWKCLEAKMVSRRAGHWGGKNDGVVRYPISLDTLFLLDNVGGRKGKGSVMLGTMMMVYD